MLPVLETDYSRSTLELRLNELECISKRLKSKAKIVDLEPSTSDQDLARLRQRLESQLQLMQESIGVKQNEEVDEADDLTYDISTLDPDRPSRS